MLPTYKIDSIEDFVSLFSVNSVPYIEAFTRVVIGIAVLIGFLVVCLSMYTAVLERTREIGILKALGASPGYIVGILLRETVLLALAGTVVGILMTYGTRMLMATFAPSMPQEIVPDWYLRVAGIALAGSIVGALYPGLRAARLAVADEGVREGTQTAHIRAGLSDVLHGVPRHGLPCAREIRRERK